MSCDDNHEARAKDRVRRSLPVVGSGGSAAGRIQWTDCRRRVALRRKLWRSLEERIARGHAGRGQRISRRRRRAGGDLAPRVHAAARRLDGGRHRRRGLPQAEREDHSVRAPPRGADSRQRAPLRDRLRARGLHERPPGREPRGAPDQDRGEPGAPRDAGRHHLHRAGPDPRPLRRRSRQAAAPRRHARSPGRRSWPR